VCRESRLHALKRFTIRIPIGLATQPRNAIYLDPVVDILHFPAEFDNFGPSSITSAPSALVLGNGPTGEALKLIKHVEIHSSAFERNAVALFETYTGATEITIIKMENQARSVARKTWDQLVRDVLRGAQGQLSRWKAEKLVADGAKLPGFAIKVRRTWDGLPMTEEERSIESKALNYHPLVEPVEPKAVRASLGNKTNL